MKKFMAWGGAAVLLGTLVAMFGGDIKDLRPLFVIEAKANDEAIRAMMAQELADVRSDLEIVANGVNYIRWQELDRKAQAGTLGPRERVEYCQLSAQLGIRGIGCA